jgi:AcrR family transcriptional regulator
MRKSANLDVRQPAQARSRERVQRILQATEELVEQVQLDDITVAMISDRSGVKRATIYQFFPTVQAILTVLGQRFLDEIYNDFARVETSRKQEVWRQTTHDLIDVMVDFYSHHPAACSLFLGDGSLHGLRLIDQDFDRRFVELLRAQLGGGPSIQPTADGDPLQVAVMIGISTISISVHRLGRITEYYRSQARRAVQAYLATLLDAKLAA